jgi:hypothetical protein
VRPDASPSTATRPAARPATGFYPCPHLSGYPDERRDALHCAEAAPPTLLPRIDHEATE